MTRYSPLAAAAAAESDQVNVCKNLKQKRMGGNKSRTGCSPFPSCHFPDNLLPFAANRQIRCSPPSDLTLDKRVLIPSSASLLQAGA